MARPLTLGFISAWPIYQGTTIDRYAHSLIQGLSAAAHAAGCRLLPGCGFSVTGNSPPRRSFWPVPGPGVDFAPVGPWNTDGLIIVPDELTEAQRQYVRDLQAAGFPVIFTTPEGPGPLVKVDNARGIRAAFAHLWEHGHRQSAFIAGNANRRGDSRERLAAYREALAEAGLPAGCALPDDAQMYQGRLGRNGLRCGPVSTVRGGVDQVEMGDLAFALIGCVCGKRPD